ncbi:TetR/AcrR family transcriptional regulator [Paraburkholderia sprentiae WSM5005]|uniref:TetR/AcrR family transcriptional regulator n=1 Tax=Paraburkholderia sprentiae WSM5005 TaxID=754502 RepID=A0A1I9YCK8_9BURK|nr:TetR/AcrR family transcriptional regulator [Paraburkholderia sprentiae]APA84041.1 TetR/AcrR family transcriptional regulator [Paraburkholderia sprentiae WSM5005]
MPRQRLTRAENREQTRQRLLDAAYFSITRKGLAATSVEDIAGHAGYTRGAFYSNFGNKSDLFVELLRLDHQHIQEKLQKLLDAAPSGDDLHKQFASLYAHCYRDSDNYIIWSEARLHAMRDSQFRQWLNALYLEKHHMIAYFIERLCTRLNIPLSSSVADHALAAIALMDGVLYFDMTMPNDLPSASAEAILCNVFTKMFFHPSS